MWGGVKNGSCFAPEMPGAGDPHFTGYSISKIESGGDCSQRSKRPRSLFSIKNGERKILFFLVRSLQVLRTKLASFYTRLVAWNRRAPESVRAPVNGWQEMVVAQAPGTCSLSLVLASVVLCWKKHHSTPGRKGRIKGLIH